MGDEKGTPPSTSKPNGTISLFTLSKTRKASFNLLMHLNMFQLIPNWLTLKFIIEKQLHSEF